MSFNGIQQYVQRKARVMIDLRTMRPSEKQKVVNDARHEYTKRKATWQPADLTEGWIRDSRSDELFQEFITRRLQENTHRKMMMKQHGYTEVEYETEAHPLIEALTDDKV